MTQTVAPTRPTPNDPERRRGGPYAELPRLSGGWFLPVAFAARLPFSMLTIGTLALVTESTGSVALGGLVGAASALGTAAGGPVQGAVADRRGQRPVLLVCAPVAVLAILALVAAAGSGAPTPLLVAAAALTGAAVPQVGPLARVRWLGLARGRDRVLSAAMSYESTADEVGFVLGPALVGVLASLGSPRTAILVALALIAVFGTAFALHPTAAAAPAGRPAPGPGGRGLLGAVAAPALGMVAMGVLFGGMQTAVTAFAADAGVPDASGLLYAVMGVGSAVTALSVVALPSRWTLPSRWLVFAAGLSLAAGALLALGTGAGIGALTAGLAATGLFVGPLMVTIFSVVGERAPADRTAAAMTIAASANVVGVALGAALGGRLAQSVSTTSAFGVPLVAALALAVVGLVVVRSAAQRTRPAGSPETAG